MFGVQNSLAHRERLAMQRRAFLQTPPPLFQQASDGVVETTAVGSVATYWVLSLALLGIVTNIRKRWREFLLLVVVMAVTLAAAELLVRLVLPYRAMVQYRGVVASPRFHHILPRNQRMFRGFYEDEPTIVTTNEDGFRSEYTREAFRGYNDRIVVLGDSFAFGVFA